MPVLSVGRASLGHLIAGMKRIVKINLFGAADSSPKSAGSLKHARVDAWTQRYLSTQANANANGAEHERQMVRDAVRLATVDKTYCEHHRCHSPSRSSKDRGHVSCSEALPTLICPVTNLLYVSAPGSDCDAIIRQSGSHMRFEDRSDRGNSLHHITQSPQRHDTGSKSEPWRAFSLKSRPISKLIDLQLGTGTL